MFNTLNFLIPLSTQSEKQQEGRIIMARRECSSPVNQKNQYSLIYPYLLKVHFFVPQPISACIYLCLLYIFDNTFLSVYLSKRPSLK